MANRRRLSAMGYGPGTVQPSGRASVNALPPPPDGSIPTRLPIGNPQAPQQPPMQGEGGDDSGDPLAAILRLLNEQQGQ